MSRHNSRMGSFSPTQRRACIVLVLCVLAVILSAVFSWVLLPGLLGRGGGRTGDYDPDQYPVDTTLGSVLPASAADGSYLSSTVFVGGPYTDSLYTTGQITLDQYLGADGLTIGDILQRSCISFAQDSNTYTVPQALAKMKPRRAIITLGGADLDGATVDSFIMDYRNVLRSLSTAYSYCDLIVNALPPVAETSEGAAARQTLIDQINQQLAIVCNEDGYKFLNSAEVLKADTGFADPTYFEGNGYNASAIENTAEKKMETIINAGTLSPVEAIYVEKADPDVGGVTGFISKNAKVSVTQAFKLPSVFRIVGLPDKAEIKVEVTAPVISQTEFVRNVKFVEDIIEELSEKSETVSKITETIGIAFTRISDFFKG